MVLDLGAIEIRHLSVMNSFKSFVYKNMQVKNKYVSKYASKKQQS